MIYIEFAIDEGETSETRDKLTLLATDLKKHFTDKDIKIHDVLVRTRPRVDLLQISSTK